MLPAKHNWPYCNAHITICVSSTHSKIKFKDGAERELDTNPLNYKAKSSTTLLLKGQQIVLHTEECNALLYSQQKPQVFVVLC